MTMELEHLSDLPARSVYISTDDSVEMAAGDRLKIKVKGDDDPEILNERVPNGKAWTVRFNIVVTETDA